MKWCDIQGWTEVFQVYIESWPKWDSKPQQHLLLYMFKQMQALNVWLEIYGQIKHLIENYIV